METTVLSSTVTLLEALHIQGAQRVTGRALWEVFTPGSLRTRGTKLLRQALLPLRAGPQAVKEHGDTWKCSHGTLILHPIRKEIGSQCCPGQHLGLMFYQQRLKCFSYCMEEISTQSPHQTLQNQVISDGVRTGAIVSDCPPSQVTRP